MNGSPPNERGRGQPDPGTDNTPNTARITDAGDLTRDVVTYQVGYGTGYQVGYVHGRRDENDEWQTTFGVYRAAVRTPRHAELERLRQPSNEPCPTRCRSCSRCARHAQVWRNRRRYGTCDYPGGVA
jgi:hypothetical protein